MQQAEVDFGDTVLGDQPGLNSEMQQLRAFQNRFNLSSTEAQPLLKWLPLHKRRCGHRCVAVQNAIKGYIPNLCTFLLIIAHTSSYAKRRNFWLSIIITLRKYIPLPRNCSKRRAFELLRLWEVVELETNYLNSFQTENHNKKPKWIGSIFVEIVNFSFRHTCHHWSWSELLNNFRYKRRNSNLKSWLKLNFSFESIWFRARTEMKVLQLRQRTYNLLKQHRVRVSDRWRFLILLRVGFHRCTGQHSVLSRLIQPK